jgi:mono/diheme cytochrome c family protein
VRQPGSDRRTGSARLAAAVALVVALGVAGCNKDSGDLTRGQQLFTSRCGTCHQLAAAGSSGVQGPSLDDAFAAARARGMDSDTIAGVVKAQVENPRPMTANPSVSMPPDLASGQDLNDIAAFVGHVAGTGAKVPKLTTSQLFVSTCGTCHTLAAAQTSGTTGPNLDTGLAKQTKAEIKQSIISPDAKITPGYAAGIMPPSFGQSIQPADLKGLVDYLYASTHKGK